MMPSVRVCACHFPVVAELKVRSEAAVSTKKTVEFCICISHTDIYERHLTGCYSSLSKVSGYGLGFLMGTQIFLSSSTCRPALEPVQLVIHFLSWNHLYTRLVPLFYRVKTPSSIHFYQEI
jgi:hypothetical protein